MFGYGNGYAAMKKSQGSNPKTSAKIEGFAGGVKNPDRKFYHDASTDSVATTTLNMESDPSERGSGDLVSRLSAPRNDIDLEVIGSGRLGDDKGVQNNSAVWRQKLEKHMGEHEDNGIYFLPDFKSRKHFL